MSYLSDMDDLDMTCSDIVNALKMLVYFFLNRKNLFMKEKLNKKET